jgi:hypothetical protein
MRMKKMKTKGRRTIVENVDVDIDAEGFLSSIYNKSIPKTFNYIGSDGHWYRQNGFDYHKREELYTKERLATPEEIEFQKAYRIMLNFVKDHDL